MELKEEGIEGADGTEEPAEGPEEIGCHC